MDQKYVLVCRSTQSLDDVCSMAVRLGYDFFTDNAATGVIFFVASDRERGPAYYSTGLTVNDLR